jgi:uncharacterized membrane protein YkvA (DUF1232 family)
MRLLARLKQWAQSIKQDVHAVYLASRDPRVPWYVKVTAICVAAYALSPMDLIPDFIPVIGYLDDLIIIPVGLLLVVKMMPREILAEHRARAASMQSRPTSLGGAVAIIIIWIVAIAASAWLAVTRLS